MNNLREVLEGEQTQGSVETIIYTLDVTNIGASPTSPSTTVTQLSTNTNVTSTVMPTGSISISGNTLILKPLTLLTPGERYRVATKFTIGSSTFESFFIVVCDF